MGTKNLDDSRKRALCSKMELFVTKLDSNHVEFIRIVKSDTPSDWLSTLSENKDYHWGMLKQYVRAAGNGNQTSLLSTLAGDTDSDNTVIDAGNGAIVNLEEKIEVSSLHSATNGSKKVLIIANSRSSRRRQMHEMELANLRANKKEEQRLQDWQLELKQECEEIEFFRRQEELRFQQQQQQPEQKRRLQQQRQKKREQQLRLNLHPQSSQTSELTKRKSNDCKIDSWS